MSPPRSARAVAAACAAVAGTMFLALLLPARPAHAAPSVVAASIDPCDVPLVGTACDVVGGALGLPGDIASGAANAAVDAFAGWMASGISDLLSTVADAMFSGGEVDLFASGQGGEQWFAESYGTMATIGLAVFAPMLLLAVLHALFSQSGAVLGRA